MTLTFLDDYRYTFARYEALRASYGLTGAL